MCDKTDAANLFFIRRYFRDAAQSFFLESLASEIARFDLVWDSPECQEALQEIAHDLSEAYFDLCKASDQVEATNDFVDERLRALPWTSISAAVAGV